MKDFDQNRLPDFFDRFQSEDFDDGGDDDDDDEEDEGIFESDEDDSIRLNSCFCGFKSFCKLPLYINNLINVNNFVANKIYNV